MVSPNGHPLLDSNSPALHLTHPTDAENLSIWNLTASSWKDALPESVYLKESSYLMTVPLAKDGGMTQWILVDKNLPPNQRALLASCETFRKRSWIITDEEGVSNLTEMVTHGVASVYCDSKYRGRGYASRLMKELANVLPNWQTETMNCVASVLFSDIGKEFYTKLGWRAFPSYHIEFAPSADISRTAKPILAGDLEQLCKEDEELSRKALINAKPWSLSDRRTKFMIVPDHDHMLWHHSKEEFAAQTLFQNTPKIKGAITGEPGNRIWAIWTHRFYEPPERSSNNVLYILRLVVEDQSDIGNPLQIEQLKSIISAARAEAADWNLHHVKIWDPSPQIKGLIKHIGVPYHEEHRQEEGICSLLWYGPGDGTEDSIEWVSNEKYGWC
ncbi:hypothetical protein BGW36DRAFT_395482 [Talaromyces proteolyticus]|uniref:N-acetyltransferase domain-containing protein n=1 Tax=Talaromyces proteolyticus TaxID=1131652 RepID=A0AAD4PXT0_9EURO|nr:uncharacterized protein BGW36DRAFT_395482 [Talaromyces proteolyticus]KAH8700370.1 hypothetical protein BGW36DRAFT_395482 [Talaromyces proteolyticus]